MLYMYLLYSTYACCMLYILHSIDVQHTCCVYVDLLYCYNIIQCNRSIIIIMYSMTGTNLDNFGIAIIIQ